MDDDTEVADSTSKQQSPPRHHRQKVDAYHQVLRLVQDLKYEEASATGFEDDLWLHFRRLPARYAFDVNAELAEDVLAHKRLLTLAKDGPVFEIRPVQVHPTIEHNPLDALVKDDAQTLASLSGKHRSLHEIIFSTADRPKLLAELTLSLSDLGLNIQEARAFSTSDGYSLGAFVVDGWPQEGGETLKAAVESQISKIKTDQPKSRILQDFEVLRHLGFGGYANVFLCRHKIDDNLYALKLMMLTGEDPCPPNMAVRETKILSSIRHTNIVFYHQAWYDTSIAEIFEVSYGESDVCEEPVNDNDKFLCLQMEYCISSLKQVLTPDEYKYEEGRAVAYFRQILFAVCYLHERGIVHRDISPGNILIDNNDTIKLADFGLATSVLLGELNDPFVNSVARFYKAPELIQKQKANEKVDIYSLGMIWFELCNPFGTYSERKEIMGQFRDGTLAAEDYIMSSLMKLMIAATPSDRPSAEEILHNFV